MNSPSLWALPFLIATFLLSPAKAFHVVIDPGHGGVDTGATYSGVKESDLVLKVALKLQNLLKNNPQFKTTLTRTTNQSLSLQDRVLLAEKSKADLFLSLHANAAGDQRARGIEFFFQNSLPADEESLFLAHLENQSLTAEASSTEPTSETLSKNSDVSAIVEDLRRQSRLWSSMRLSETLHKSWTASKHTVIKQAPFYVISKTTMPAVLIEIGFLSNPREVKELSSPAYQQDIAQKIYNALLTYKEKVDNPPLKTIN